MGFYTFLTIDDLSFRLFGLELSTTSQTSEIGSLRIDDFRATLPLGHVKLCVAFL